MIFFVIECKKNYKYHSTLKSTYWNEVHGFTADDEEKDLEGLQTMRNLARNTAFLVKAINAQKEKEGLPRQEHEYMTNFIKGE